MDLTGAVVVVVGSMNPAIFNTGWLRRHRITDEDEVGAAETRGGISLKGQRPIELVGSWDAAQIPCKSFLLSVDLERLALQTTIPTAFGLVRDVACRIFAQLGHVPVRSVGVNFDGRVALGENQPRPPHLFTAERSRVDAIFPEGWRGNVRFTSLRTEPCVKVDVSERLDLPDTLVTHVNFQYDQVRAGSEVPELLTRVFEPNRVEFERLMGELLR